MNLTRTQCNELKGLAILSIILHNFIHQQRFGFAQQNESSFAISRTMDFFSGLGDGIGNAICEISSFLGWIGVPVFVFLSGYGLVKKYESSQPFSRSDYVKHSWLKLFLLMLPGVLYFAIYMQFNDFGGVGVMARYVIYLSMLGNLFGLYNLTPGVYWYFGLTFELYLFYLVFERYRSNKLIWLSITITLLIQCILSATGPESLVRYSFKNFIGWLPIFAAGIYTARSSQSRPNFHIKNPMILLLVLVLCTGLLILCNLSQWTWIFIHFAGVAFFIILMWLIEKSGFLRRFFSYLGTISAFIFVCHPIARIITNDIHLETWPIFAEILLYLGLMMAIVFVYRFIVNLLVCRH